MNEFPISLDGFFAAHDFSLHTAKAIRADLARFSTWFETANGESLDLKRVTVRDVADFRDSMRNVRRLSVSSVNRALFSVRKFLAWAASNGDIQTNPARSVKELRRVPSVPKGLDTPKVRKLIREVELRGDQRAAAVLGCLYLAGLRVSEVAALEVQDITVAPRSGHLTVRNGKGNKQRLVPLCVEARRVLSEYLEVRPPVKNNRVFIGERGPLTEQGIRCLCSKYMAITGVTFSPHTLRHTFAHRFLEQSGNDIVALAQILGHENLNTTAIYTRRSQDDLQQRVEELRYG